MRLSAEQRAAVDAGAVDLFIGAGAGSGKTRVLTARFVHAVLGVEPYRKTSPRDILTVTFTDRAAGELAERIRGALIAEGSMEGARRVEEAWISTIHGMCSKILRQHAFDAGLDPQFAVASEVEAGVLAREAFEKVVRDAMAAGDKDVDRLMDAMRYDEIVSAVIRAYADVRSMGRQLLEVHGLSGQQVDAEIAAVVNALVEVRERLSIRSQAQGKTLSDNMERLEQAISVGHALRNGGGAGTEGPCELPKVRRARGDEVQQEIADQANVLLERLTSLHAQLLVKPFERAIIKLLVAFHGAYTELKSNRSLLDFEDLQVLVAELFEQRPDIAAEYRRRFSMVMIDEFQDTNELQLRIAHDLAADRLCTVGDDKQSIYSFRHANVEVFKARERSGQRVERLADNYRSHPELLAFFNGLFGHESLFGSDFMQLHPGAQEPDERGWPEDRDRARVVLVDTGADSELSGVEAEAVAMADEFVALRDEGVDQEDMVLLLRKMSGAAEVFERELKRRGFDVFIASGGTFHDTQEIEEVVSLLRLIDNAADSSAALIVLAGRFTGVSDDGLFGLRESAGRHGNLWAAARRAAELSICTADKTMIARTVGIIERARAARGSIPLRDLLLSVLEDLDYDLALLATGDSGVRAWANVLKLVRMAGEFQETAHGDVGSFLDYLSLRQEYVASEQQATVAGERAKAVRIMSVHSAKGLEFPVVGVASFSSATPGPGSVLVGESNGAVLLGMRLPMSEGSKSRSVETAAHSYLAEKRTNTESEEVKRLLYVACTRAERGLVLCMRSNLGKTASGDRPPDLVRKALGLDEPTESVQPCVLPGGVRVDVRIVAPDTESLEDDPTDLPATCEVPSALEEPPELEGMPPVVPATISYSGLALYARCPYRFYAEKIAGIPRGVDVGSAGGTDPREFGNAVHEALAEMFGGSGWEESRLEVIGQAHGLAGSEVERLYRAVKAFGGSSLAAEVCAADKVITECAINAPVGSSVLVGSIDLLAWSGQDALVVDYKTGDSELSEDDARDRYEMQASCYALAVLRAGAETVRVVFFEPERDGRQIVFVSCAGDADAIEARVARSLVLMSQGEYQPLPRYDAAVCKECQVSGSLCPVTPGGAG
ncbi:MAG: UvrD-helicase domain-containing protein [Coriobacteriia bacterium]|nr:UvrD-helicase domain-containing protein [Coriobacteriia bacterium]